MTPPPMFGTLLTWAPVPMAAALRKSPLRMCRGGHVGLDVPGVEGLAEVLEAGEEEHLVAVLVEAGARDDEGPAEREAGVDELVLDPVGADLVREPLVRVQTIVAQVAEERAMEIAAARLADDAHGHRALGVLGPEVRLQDLELLHELGVRVDGGRAVAAGIGAGSAVDRDVEGPVAGAVGGVVPDRALLAALAVAVDPVDLAEKPGSFFALLPPVPVMPGSRRRTSAALVPMIGMFSICSAVRVALFSPELSGVRATSAVTETVSATVATLRAIWRSERLSPDRSSTAVTS